MRCPDARTFSTGALSVAAVAVPAAAAAACLGLALRPTGALAGRLGHWWPGSEASAAVGHDQAGAVLLELACLALALVLAWAAVAVAAGVREGWRLARGPVAVTDPAAARPAGLHLAGTRRAGPRPAPTPPTTTAHPGGLVAAAVAALVVAALTAPTASAAATRPSTSTDVARGTGSGVQVTAPAVPGTDDAPPGSWSALTDRTAATGEGPGDGPALDDGIEAPSSGPSAGTAPSIDAGPAAGAGPTAGEGFLAPRTVDPRSVGLVTSPDSRSERTRPEVVVHRGDSLWSLVADHLGPQASDAEVARAWPGWWQHNRDVIGDDPDVLVPGQTLLVPAS